MAANVDPIYSRAPDVQWAVNCTAGNNTADLTSGTSYLIFSADPTEGGWVGTIRIKANPGQNTAATVARLWVNNGGAIGTDTNSALVSELTIAAMTASAVAAQPDYTMPFNQALPPGYKLYMTFGTAPGGSGEFTVTVFGGKY